MFSTPPLSLLLVAAAAILGAVGQFLFQHAARSGDAGERSAASALVSPWALAGAACYIAVLVMFTSAFRMGGTVRVLYPIYASTFIWAAVMSLAFFGQPIRLIRGVGMVLLIAGILCMSW